VPWDLRVQQAVLSKRNAFPYIHFMNTTTSQTVCIINFYFNLNVGFYSLSGSWDNVVSKVTSMAWAVCFSNLGGGKVFFFWFVQNFQTDSGNRPASYSISKGLFPKHKAGLE